MSKLDALKLALSNAKLHTGLNVRK
jgi:hypothetical protein